MKSFDQHRGRFAQAALLRFCPARNQHKSKPRMILCIGTTPAAQRVMIFRELKLDAVNRAVATLDGAAGKAVNVAKVLKTFGEEPLAAGFLGGDRGKFVLETIEKQGIKTAFVTIAARTRECVTVIDETTGHITELVEESPLATPAEYQQLLEKLEEPFRTCRAVVLSGTIAPGGDPGLYARWIREVADRGILTVVDAQGAVLARALEARPGLVKPNRTELRATLGRKLEDEAAVIQAMRALTEQGALRIVVTAGKEPTLAFDGERVWRLRPPRVKVVNPIGSGDAFTAGLVFGLMRGDNLGEACRWGAAAGSANAMTAMAGEVTRENVERLAAEIRLEQVE